MWSSAVITQFPQGSSCCLFGDAFLLTMVLKCGCLSCRSLPVSSNQSNHSPLTIPSCLFPDYLIPQLHLFFVCPCVLVKIMLFYKDTNMLVSSFSKKKKTYYFLI